MPTVVEGLITYFRVLITQVRALVTLLIARELHLVNALRVWGFGFWVLGIGFRV